MSFDDLFRKDLPNKMLQRTPSQRAPDRAPPRFRSQGKPGWNLAV